ncbi:putative uncharacterized protein DDB_G0282133 [Nilaparvata lugens]|uniref:putative uncharacterized protein DDB_G0282133 n=1 Tax=Nilaparvata lugens TaxID=108931 RepID=UPI00193C9826|nr:putative uncharacterized protein DDB_G0282133 [Nilaparvata lugens]
MMVNRVESNISQKRRNAASANISLLLLALLMLIIVNHHGASSQATQHKKPKSRVVVAAKDIPTTSFSCNDRSPGYYADVQTGCQVYHMCSEGGTQFSYRCPNTTLFQQRMLICAHWYQVNCSRSEQHFHANLLIGQRDKPFVDESEQVNIYYHGKDLKNLLNPDELQRLQQARLTSSSNGNGLQMSASEYVHLTPGQFSNFQRPRMENHFADNSASQKSTTQQNFNRQSGKLTPQFPPSSTTLGSFQPNSHNQNNFNQFQPQQTAPTTARPNQFSTSSSTTLGSFQQNSSNQNRFNSFKPLLAVSTTVGPNKLFNQQRVSYTPSTTIKPVTFSQSNNNLNKNNNNLDQNNNFNQNFNSFQPQQTFSTTTIRSIQFNQQIITQSTSTISTKAPFNVRTNPSLSSTQPSAAFHPSNQHTVAHFTTQPHFNISSSPFTNHPQIPQSKATVTQKFASVPFQSNTNQNLQVKNNPPNNNNVGQGGFNGNLPQNTEKPTTVINENTYNNFIRRFMPDEEEANKSVPGNQATKKVNSTNEYNNFLKVFVPDDTSPIENNTTDSINYNQFLKVFIPDDSAFTNSNHSYRQNSKVFGGNFVSEINSLSTDIEPPFVGLISELDAPPFDDADPVGSSLELFKLKIQDPRHAFFIPDNDNEQIPLDSQVTPITIKVQRPGTTNHHPMTFLNLVPDNCYRCHPHFIVDKEACTPCVIIR